MQPRPPRSLARLNPNQIQFMKAIPFLLLPVLALAATAQDTGIGAAAKFDENAALAVLASDADVQKKARACQQLAVVGGPNAVSPLAALLGDDKLAAYARSGLEAINDPSAGEALRTALPKLEGRLQAGVVTSLGVRGDKAAVPALQKLVAEPKTGVAGPALAALAEIGTDEALATILQTLEKGPAQLRIHAAHAALSAAEKLGQQGKKDAAQKLLKAVQAADLPDYLKKAAALGAQ